MKPSHPGTTEPIQWVPISSLYLSKQIAATYCGNTFIHLNWAKNISQELANESTKISLYFHSRIQTRTH